MSGRARSHWLAVALLCTVWLRRSASQGKAAADGDPLSCYTADARLGDCRPWRYCRVARDEYPEKKPTICLYRPRDPIVCCPQKLNGQFITTARPILFIDQSRPTAVPWRPGSVSKPAGPRPGRYPTPGGRPVSRPTAGPATVKPSAQKPSQNFIGHRDCGLVSPTVRADFDKLELRRRRRRRSPGGPGPVPPDRSHASPPADLFALFEARRYDEAEYDPDYEPYPEPPPAAAGNSTWRGARGRSLEDRYGIGSAEYREHVSQLLTEVQFITGGADSIIGRWPWIALIGEQRPRRISWFCGGALLNERFVVTAAHCLGQFQKNRLLVRVGDFDLHYDTDAVHQDLLVNRIYLHPQYEHHRKHHDIALLRLSRPARLGPLVRPVCLPPAGAELTGRWASLAGWGHTEFGGESSAILQEVRLPLVDTASCEARYRALGKSFQLDFDPGFGDTKICAHDTSGGGRDSCQGDSGGPMTFDDPATGRVQLVGIVSTGVGCGHPQFPGVYTRVAMYTDWIRQRAFEDS